MELPMAPSSGQACRSPRCSACCHDTEMLLSEADVDRLLAAGADPEGWERAHDGYLQLRTRDAPPVQGMQGRPCWYLASDGACSVYPVRPEGCRLYPAIDDVEIVLDEEHCPQTSSFTLDRATTLAVRDLVRRLVAERNARVGSSKRF